MPFVVAVTSIFENNRNDDVVVYVFYSYLSESEKETINDVGENYKKKIHLVRVDDCYFSELPIYRWSREMYYRLLVAELLPSNLERILYFDCDIVVNKSLSDFYNLDLGHDLIAAKSENCNYAEFRTKINLSSDGIYFQSGVILFDLIKCRSVLSYKTVIDVVEKIGKTSLTNPDQDIINYIFDGKIMDIGIEYNNSSITAYNKHAFSRQLNSAFLTEKDKTCVFHFATGKPWNNLYSGACDDLWMRYLLLTPYNYLYERKYGTFRFKIIRSRYFKFLFYKYIGLTPYIEKMFINFVPMKIYKVLKNFYRKNIK